MARPKSTPAADHSQHVDQQQLQQDVAAFDRHHAMLAGIETDFAIDVPYNFDVFLGRAKLLVADTGQRLLEIGRILVQIREHESRERLAEAIQVCGLSPRFAQRTMQAAVKFGGDARELLASRLGSTKLLELMSEDDDTLDALADGGTLAGATLDEIDRMSVRDLKEALRRERQERSDDRAATDELIAKKDAKLNMLSKKFRGWERSPTRDRAEELLRSVDEEALGAVSAAKRLEEAMRAVQALYEDAGQPIDADIDTRLEQAAQLLEGSYGAIAQIAGLA